jgi:ribosomal protein S18 acetylase RimI-like enzyme
MVEHGVSRQDLRHYESSCRELLDDHLYGAAVRAGARLTARYTLDPLIDIATTTPLLYDALHEAVSGHAAYRDIIRRSASVGLARRVATRVLGFRPRRKRRFMKGTAVTIRRMTVRDIDAVMRIDETITGVPHAAYWESKAAAFIAKEPDTCLVAEDANGRIVGFVLAGTRGWAYGVEPAAQGMGVSTMLLDAAVARLRDVGVTSIQTVVDWNDGALVDYFRANGFECGDLVNLVKEIGP